MKQQIKLKCLTIDFWEPTFWMALDLETPGSPWSDLLLCPRTSCFFLLTRTSKGFKAFPSAFGLRFARTASALFLPIATRLATCQVWVRVLVTRDSVGKRPSPNLRTTNTEVLSGETRVKSLGTYMYNPLTPKFTSWNIHFHACRHWTRSHWPALRPLRGGQTSKGKCARVAPAFD